ncbi:hypothetical protein H0H93_006533 [Arthromyces matolae]|nr:hypothetical protein H0H93_006533 [Arthromyces matolae]
MSHSTVSRMRNYVADPGFEGRVHWKKNYNSNILIEQDSDEGKVTEAVCVLVAEISQSKLYTDSLGNYNPQYNTLPTAKYQLTLTEPMQEPFKKDFALALETIERLQQQIATGNDNRYLLVSSGAAGGKVDGIRLSAPIAEPRTVHLEAGSALDSDTASIRVDLDQVPVYNTFKLTHKMTPLRVFGPDDEPVEPHMVTQVLRGALVEVYFAMKHYFINGSEKRYNTFGGRVEQIIVLRRAADEIPSPFRQAGRKGPFRPQLMDIKPMASLTGDAAHQYTLTYWKEVNGAKTAVAKVVSGPYHLAEKRSTAFHQTNGPSFKEKNVPNTSQDEAKSTLVAAAEIADKDDVDDSSSLSDLSEEAPEQEAEVVVVESDRLKRKSRRGGRPGEKERTGEKDSQADQKESKKRKVD